ncbi:MAG: LamG domain-containing protein, partial [Mucilaginibacter sp.]
LKRYFMKKLTYKPILAFVLIGLGITSCQKKYDASSYAPALNIGGFTSTTEIAPSNLIAYWSFNGTLKDTLSGTAGTGTGTSFTTGFKGQALQGGTGAYAVSTTPDAVQSMTSFTTTAWIYSAQSVGATGIIDISNADEFWGNMTIFFENGSTADKGVLKVHVKNDTKEAWLGNYDVQNAWNKWINIAVTYDETTSKFVIYVNGSKLAEQVVADFGAIHFKKAGKMAFGTLHFQTDPSLTSATSKQDWAGYLLGQIDEVRIYNKALSANEVGALIKLEGRGK